MSRILSATPGPNGWRLDTRAAMAGEVVEAIDEREAARIGREVLGNLFRSAGDEASTWHLEFMKSMLGEGEIALGIAQLFAMRCEAHGAMPHEVRVPSGCLQLRTVTAAMRSRGLAVRGGGFDQFLGQLKFLAAAAIAISTILWTVSRCALERKTRSGDRRFTIAVHGEDSNRTRHVLELLRAVDTPVRIIVLGRPRASLSKLREKWVAIHGRLPLELERPFGLAAAALAVPGILVSMAAGWSRLPTLPWLPTSAGLSGILFRECLGRVSARWWRAAGSSGGVVVYGHTGLADTTHLELAQQASGFRTVHAVHGLSDGLNFVGRSSVAVFRCRHDAAWHERLGGYGKCRAVAMDQPAYVHGGDRLLLLSNYLHPMNLWFRRYGPRDELRMLDEVSRAVQLSGLDWSALVWRPHPVFATQPVNVRAPVLDAVGRLGFSLWDGSREAGLSRQPAQVVCTPSSVAIDAMMAGSLPVVLDQQGVNPECAVRSLPFVATNASVLAELLAVVRDPALAEQAFAMAWQGIGPSGPLKLETLFQG